jgi:opacity protein-like surface antigen
MYNTSACSKKSKSAVFMTSLNYRGIMKSKLLAIALAAVTTVSVAEAKETKSTKAATVKSSSQSGKMYLRADAGYGFSQFKDKSQSLDKTAKGTILSTGIGYKATDAIRTELQLYHNLGAEIKEKNSGFEASLEQRTTALLGNVYYDFNNSSIFTPYVMAGAGVANNSYKEKIKVKNLEVSGKTKGKNALALQFGAGVATKVADNVFFDVRYNALHKGTELKYDGGSIKTGLEHAVMAGVRVHF